MKFITAQPYNDYFIWQMQVQINNFKKNGIEKDLVVLFAHDGKLDVHKAVKVFKSSEAEFHFIQDVRSIESKGYIPSIKPHLLKYFFRKTQLNDDVFYLDCDVTFNRLPVINPTNRILLSDTVSYIGAKYIISKGEGLLKEMCDVVGVNPAIVIANESNSGGAQYVIPKTIPMTFEFWDKVERDSVALYNLMKNTAHKYNPVHPIQKWTAEMWATLWNFWLAGYETGIDKELDFCWSTYPIEDYDKFNIYHNAGVTINRKDLFFKGDFINRSPFGLAHSNVDPKFCSIKYVQEINETALTF
ncbi:hypothetical protein WSM22_03330 [Cytophagales bacterium WSM2-2]|nr:hypothetical protein WSM22_03330 [Cytophagales bacterium WSM2-2]